MSRIPHLALSILVTGFVISDALALHRKGRVLSDTTTPVTLDVEGRPVVGGRFGLEIKPTSKGVLLMVRVPCQDGGARTVRYLAYPMKRGEATAVRVVAEPGPDCYWNQTCCGSHTRELVFDRFQYIVKEGPFQSFELQQDKDKRLVLAEKKTLIEKSRLFFGRTIKYDNLDDGK